MHIQMPSEAEKHRSIQFILDEGMPQKEPLHRVISRLIHTIGLRNLFWGTWDCIFLALLGGLTLVILFVIPSAVQTQLLPLGLLLISPAVYGLLHGLTVWKERQVGLAVGRALCALPPPDGDGPLIPANAGYLPVGVVSVRHGDAAGFCPQQKPVERSGGVVRTLCRTARPASRSAGMAAKNPCGSGNGRCRIVGSALFRPVGALSIRKS